MDSITTPDATINAGARVRLTEDHGFFDTGDTGRALLVDTDSGMAWVAFDGGAAQVIPLAVLVKDQREFRYRVRGGAMSRAFTSEEAASDAAEAFGLLDWDIVEVQHVSRNTLVCTDECAPPGSDLH